MRQHVANYTVIIEKQKRLGTNKTCFMAYVPILGIATEADTIAEVEKEIKSLIQFHLESLAQEGESVPIEADYSYVTRAAVVVPRGAALST